MAIVAALRCQGHVLIGADSKEEDRLGAYQSVRLSRFCDAQLMWGGDGDVRILKDLRAWLEAAGGFDRIDIRRPTPDTSEHGWWLENFADRLALLNGNNLSRIRQSRVADSPAESTAMALVAGYVRDMPVLVTLSRHGVPSYGTERGWTAIGDAAERFAGILHHNPRRDADDAPTAGRSAGAGEGAGGFGERDGSGWTAIPAVGTVPQPDPFGAGLPGGGRGEYGRPDPGSPVGAAVASQGGCSDGATRPGVPLKGIMSQGTAIGEVAEAAEEPEVARVWLGAREQPMQRFEAVPLRGYNAMHLSVCLPID